MLFLISGLLLLALAVFLYMVEAADEFFTIVVLIGTIFLIVGLIKVGKPPAKVTDSLSLILKRDTV